MIGNDLAKAKTQAIISLSGDLLKTANNNITAKQRQHNYGWTQYNYV